MKDDAARIAKYTGKTVAATVGLKFAAMLPVMKPNFTIKVTSLVAMETQIQGICNDAVGVSIIQYPFYLNFGRETWKAISKGVAGPSLLSVTTNICTKYVSYGLTKVVLQKIALDVFNVSIP